MPNVRTARGQNSSRFVALDGLRGVAAVMVVVYHFLLATSLSDEYLRVLSGETAASPVVDLIANTPLRYLVMGPEAVIVFFVLSGFVLVLPMLSGRGLDLWNYLPRRLLRLWLPSAAAVVLAVIVIIATQQDPAQVRSSWSQAFSFPTLTAADVVDSFFLITGSPKLNNPLWTLRWELLFSLLLPIAVLLVSYVKRGRWLWLLACGAASGLGAVIGVQALTYGPVFLAGGHARLDRRRTRRRHVSALILGLVRRRHRPHRNPRHRPPRTARRPSRIPAPVLAGLRRHRSSSPRLRSDRRFAALALLRSEVFPLPRSDIVQPLSRARAAAPGSHPPRS